MLYVKKDGGEWEPAIRKLSKEEHDRFANAAIKAVEICPAWRDAIALLRPFYDATCASAYIDKTARMGLGPMFFEEYDAKQRASALLHEASHVLYNHFIRFDALGHGHKKMKMMNVAGDFEINCGLDKLKNVDLSMGIFPHKDPFSYPANLTMEQYLKYLESDKDAQEWMDENSNGGESAVDPDCPVHGDNVDTDSQSGSGEKNEDGSGSDSAGGDESGDQSGDGGSGGQGDGEENADSGSGGGSGSSDESGDESGSGGSGSSDHSHGNSGSECSCPDPSESNGSGQSGSGGSATGSSCDTSNEAREAAADEAGIERASDAEQSIAKKNTAVRMADDAKKARQAGNGAMADFLEFASRQMSPPKVNWRSILRKTVSSMNEAIVRGRSDYSYRKPSRRMNGSKYIFPGMVQYNPKIMIGIDTSGSMQHDDYMKTLSEIEGIVRSTSRSKTGLSVFSIDTTVKDIEAVNSVDKIKLQGGGGTDMSVGFDYVNNLKRDTPDIFVLSTDGHTYWQSVEDRIKESSGRYKPIILVTTSSGYKTTTDSLKKLATVIDISEDEN